MTPTADVGAPVPTSPGGVRVERVVTSGVFELDGGSWEVENNVWVVGDDAACLVVDAAHDARAILEVVGSRRVVGVVCTHGHNDHVNAVADLVAETGATSWLHPQDRVLWDMSQDAAPGGELTDGQVLTVGDVDLRVLHTPGHAPGACCLYAPALGVVFSGDTLFQGGPGATGRSYSDFPTIIASIRTRLLDLPPETVVLTGHGDPTTIGAEAPHLQEWIDRGH
ncbi:MBL fold metallo-hydrolase [Phycicoccus endophyticus]|uniref:MBL fold metallo-hydrolase n=1 Tax=Phycicoccus endophyticus TaxID=1690220 RepID=A0A7G9R1X3_9MICO|nr:MBL fold metallo-hydrolase [Phycicoccus endophyticus]NHI18598.1 MBL fold metallo-hydrolase [Phycicoccus endophyticus]QNN49598.1 MBL fold metallo-hydrolase [Phycicoccus endophyticus]GGL33172.1 hydrolase [Phycicoccus endophyticus]